MSLFSILDMEEELKKFFEPWELKILELIEDLEKDKKLRFDTNNNESSKENNFISR